MENRLNYQLINKLDQDVINKICAGEVIHRPLNVVKELIENSLDAGATSIIVTIKNGIKQITIQDNGCGINKEDLKLVCNRFTTSKLKSLDDFNSLTTFGFRGEALSSISIVAQVRIVSKTVDSICAYTAEYVDGHLKDDNSITPTAASQGTTIVVENLFYNMPTRKSALSSDSQEINLIQELLIKYCLIFSGKCGFILKKHDDNIHLINTKMNNTLFNNIDRLFGQDISSHLIPINLQNEKLNYRINGYFSNNDLNLKKFNFILSINSRLVECNSLKRSIKELYKNFLMKGGHSFVLLFIEIHPKNIDINIHPTKSEVCFLYDNEIISGIIGFIENKLKNKPEKDVILNKTLDFYLESSENLKSNILNSTLNSGVSIEQKNPCDRLESDFSLSQKEKKNSIANLKNKDETTIKKSNKKLAPNKFIRIDYKLQRIDQYLNKRNSTAKQRRSLELTSLFDLRHELGQKTDQILLNLVSESSYVGCVDENFLLIQHQLNLFLLRTTTFNKELFYQIFLLDFGNFNYIKFTEPLSIRALLSTYFEVHYPADVQIHYEKINDMIKLLISKYELLDDYFSIKINTADETIEALPVLIENHEPNFFYLPEFLFCLISNVNWNREKECFHSLGQELATFYSHPPNITDDSGYQFWSNLIENNIYPLYKSLLLPSKNLEDKSVHLITNVSSLYKVFERC